MKLLSIIRKVFNGAVLPVTIVNGVCMLLGVLCPFIEPGKFVYLQFMGLAFPVFFLINLILLFYWWVQLKMTLLLPLCLFVFNLYFISKYVQVSLERDIPSEKIKLASLNCRSFGRYSDSSFVDIALKQFKKEQADILCLQEFYTRSKDSSYAESIKRNCHYSQYVFIPISQGQKYGMVIYSKYPIIKYGKISFDGRTGNMAMFADVVRNSDTIRIFNIHLQSIRFNRKDYKYVEGLQGEKNPSFDQSMGLVERMKQAYLKRAVQADTIAANVARSPYPVLMSGDVNDVPASYAYNTVARGLNDAFRERGAGIETTYTGPFPSFRIDYIFASRNMFVYQYKSHRHIPSDHKMITAVFGPPSKKTN